MRGEPDADIDHDIELFCCGPFQRLDFRAATDVVDRDSEIQAVEACHEFMNMLTRSRGGIKYGDSKLDGFEFSLELNLFFLELLRVPAVQDDIEAVGGMFSGDTKADSIAGSCY